MTLCVSKAEFSVWYDLSQIALIFGAQEIFIIYINAENSCTAFFSQDTLMSSTFRRTAYIWDRKVL